MASSWSSSERVCSEDRALFALRAGHCLLCWPYDGVAVDAVMGARWVVRCMDKERRRELSRS